MAPEEPAPPVLAEPVDAAGDDAAPVTPDEEDSPAFTDEEEDAREKPAEPEEG